MAQAAAVTSHLSELALRALATRAGQLPGPPVSETQLRDAADFMVGMRAAWHQVDRMWDVMITESRMLPTQAMTDASDLVLRMGRLVWDDPHWTPAHSRRAPLRNPAALAPETDAVTTVIAAVHQSVDALARVAKADMDAVEAAGQAGRLYVPTRSLPEDYDVPRPFATAPVSRCQVLHEAYRVALDASVQAARALDELSVTAGTPSKMLALARAAASAQSRRPGSQPRPDDGIPGGPQPADIPFTHSRASTGRPGPVEQAIRERHISDPVMLLRAAAIDNAARQLIAQAQDATPVSSSPDTPTSRRRAAGSAAQLAAQSFPRDLTARPAAGQPAALSKARHQFQQPRHAPGPLTVIIGIGATCPPVLYVLRSTSAGASDLPIFRRSVPDRGQLPKLASKPCSGAFGTRARPRPEDRLPPATRWPAGHPVTPTARPGMTHRDGQSMRRRTKITRIAESGVG